MTGRIEQEADGPGDATHEDGRGACVDVGVDAVVTHEHVAVDADAADAEQGHDTRRDADAAEGDAHARLAFVEEGALHHA